MGQPNTGVQTNLLYKVGDERLDYTELKPRGVSHFKFRQSDMVV
jgi:hypothetical protein